MYPPGQKWRTPDRPRIYHPQDLYIGAKIDLRDHIFAVISADKFTLNFMEHNPAQFIFADIKLIMQKIRENMRPIYKDFIAKYLHKVTTEIVGGKNVSFICFEDLK